MAVSVQRKEWVALTVANQQHLYYRLTKVLSPSLDFTPRLYKRSGWLNPHPAGSRIGLTMPQYLFNERKSLNESVTAVINSLLALLLLLNNYLTLKPKDYLY